MGYQIDSHLDTIWGSERLVLTCWSLLTAVEVYMGQFSISFGTARLTSSSPLGTDIHVRHGNETSSKCGGDLGVLIWPSTGSRGLWRRRGLGEEVFDLSRDPPRVSWLKSTHTRVIFHHLDGGHFDPFWVNFIKSGGRNGLRPSPEEGSSRPHMGGSQAGSLGGAQKGTGLELIQIENTSIWTLRLSTAEGEDWPPKHPI